MNTSIMIKDKYQILMIPLTQIESIRVNLDSITIKTVYSTTYLFGLDTWLNRVDFGITASFVKECLTKEDVPLL